MRKDLIGAAILTTAILVLAFTNCSSQHSFQITDERKLASLNASGTIVINNGDAFTKSESVSLSILHAEADQMYVTDDPKCETGGKWEPIAALKPWTLTALNSSANVYVKFSNDGTLTSECLSDSILHDNIPPSLSIPTPPPAFTNAQNVDVVLVSADSGSGLDGAVCSGATKASCTAQLLTLTAPPEGSHSVSVTVKDRAGNLSAPVNASLVIDRTAPTATLNLTPPKISGLANGQFQFSGADSVSGIERFECRSASNAAFAASVFKPCTSGMSVMSAAGPQKFEVRSVDRAGNMSTPAVYDWIVDLAAPTVQITKYPTIYSNQSLASFEFVGTDDSGPLTSYECKIDSGSVTSCASPFMSAPNLSEGSHTFSVTGKDVAGNQSAPATYTWTIDKTPPTITITSKPDPITMSRNADFVLVGADSSSGVASLECQINGAGYKPCTTTVNFPALVDGDYKFDARAIDRAGNTSLPASHTWIVDTSKPTIMITSGPAPWVNVRAASIEMTAADVNASTKLPQPTIQCRLNDSAFAPCRSPAAFNSLLETTHVFAARAIDAAGNISDEAKLTWGIDLTPPAINFGKQPLSLLYRGDVSELAFAATDSTSGLESVRCGIDGAMADCTATYANAFLNLPAGNHTFSVVAKDRATNESVSSVTWQISDKYNVITQQVDVKRNAKLDVLVVIDNSGSMATEHANMAARFDSFIDQLAGVDWQIGIVTTDVSGDAIKKDGRLVEFLNGGNATGKYVIDSTMGAGAAKSWFASTIQMATNGSGNEQGVASSLRAVQRSQQAGNAVSLRNKALFRNDAALAILVVTDADETNPNGTESQNRPETLIGFVKATWPTKPLSFHSIIVPVGDATCRGKDGNESYGNTYDAISKLTGGIIGTVCATDYGTQLRDIGKSSQELATTVQLTCLPLDVNRDGTPDLQVTTSNGTPPPSFTFEGMRVKFSMPLPVGINTLVYNCVRPL